MIDILLLDPSFGSLNKGDEIIMECVESELAPLFKGNFVMKLPTQVSPFHWYQVARNSRRVQKYAGADYKFVGGSNVMVKDLLTHFPQWNINLFNYQPLKGSILVGVGAGAGNKSNRYTEYIYKHLLSHDYIHSVRDERSKQYVESLGLKAINTGCVTMWALTPEFCHDIPSRKSDRVVFTLTANNRLIEASKHILQTLKETYKEIFFWPQGSEDLRYLNQIGDMSDITILDASKEAYHEYLLKNDTDYVGTRLHGGVYAMRHKRRSIIISIDERASSINQSNHLNCIDIKSLQELNSIINTEIITEVRMNQEAISIWKSQFDPTVNDLQTV